VPTNKRNNQQRENKHDPGGILEQRLCCNLKGHSQRHGNRRQREGKGPPGNEKFNAVEAFRTFEGSREKRLAEEKAKREAALDKIAAGFESTDSGLRYQIIQKGSGAKAEKGKTVSVHYKGQLPDGTVFDSSYKRNQPIDFPLGMGQVIAGWDEGISLLKVGDKARFVIPSDLGYGSRGAGGVIKKIKIKKCTNKECNQLIYKSTERFKALIVEYGCVPVDDGKINKFLGDIYARRSKVSHAEIGRAERRER